MSRMISILALGLALGACGSQSGTELPDEVPAEVGANDQATPVRTQLARMERVDEGIRLIGSSSPVRAANLGPQMTGTIMEIFVDEGSVVSLGDVLVRLDARATAIGAQQAQAMAAAAAVQAEQTSSEVERLRPLARDGTVASQQYDQLLAQQRATSASANAANAAVAQARNSLRNSALRAPFDGVVSRVIMEVGETATMMPPSVVLRIVDLSELEVRGRVSERYLPNLDVGAPVSARFIALDRVVEGRVTFVGLEVDAMTRSVEVIARIPNEDRTLRAGTSVELTIGAGDPREGVVVPSDAIGGAGEARRAFVVIDGVARSRNVVVRPLGDGRIEVESGIESGEAVIVPFTSALRDGSPVSVGAPDSDARSAAVAEEQLR